MFPPPDPGPVVLQALAVYAVAVQLFVRRETALLIHGGMTVVVLKAVELAGGGVGFQIRVAFRGRVYGRALEQGGGDAPAAHARRDDEACDGFHRQILAVVPDAPVFTELLIILFVGGVAPAYDLPVFIREIAVKRALLDEADGDAAQGVPRPVSRELGFKPFLILFSEVIERAVTPCPFLVVSKGDVVEKTEVILEKRGLQRANIDLHANAFLLELKSRAAGGTKR